MGNSMNLKEALARGKLKQFAKEHENKYLHPQGKERFDALMAAMVKERRRRRWARNVRRSRRDKRAPRGEPSALSRFDPCSSHFSCLDALTTDGRSAYSHS